MRLLLVANASYHPPQGGSTRSNLVWLRALVRAGHECTVLCPPAGRGDPAEDEVSTDGIRILRVRDLGRHPEHVARRAAELLPDFVLVSSEDLSHTLLREAARCAPGRLVYLAHTPQWFPFGPEAWNPDAGAAAAVRSARGIVAIGAHMAAYIERHLSRTPRVVHPPVYGPAPPAAPPEDGSVLMVNPCNAKGLPIFLGLAARFPQVRFAALAGWGTTAEDRAALARLPNVTVSETVPRIDAVYRRTRVLLVPSLWYEGFGLVAVEAMLRGIPVLASEHGGLAEAMEGVPGLLPVNPIHHWRAETDSAGMPRAEVPAQNLEPWAAALGQLLSDPLHYRRSSETSREKAASFVSSLRAEELEEYLTELHRPRRLRILLAHNSTYYPSHGGGDHSNRLLMEALAVRGHEVRVVARVEGFSEGAHSSFLQSLSTRETVPDAVTARAVWFRRHGVAVETVTRDPRFRAYFEQRLREFDPDVVIVSTDDPAHLLLEAALEAPRARVVFLARAPIALPFGPEASSPSPDRARRLAACDAWIGVSEYVAGYLREHGRLEALHVPISLLPAATAPALGAFTNEYVCIVNPCAVKGIDLFAALAEALPHVRFAAVPTWGTTLADRARLSRLGNVDVIAPYDDIDELFRRTRVLLAPSVWAEARSRIVVEALARGVPVLGARLGGIPEAMCGLTETLLPVNPVRGYRAELDENFVPVAEVPPQNLAPWRDALQRLTTDPDYYDDLSRRGRDAALRYLDRLSVIPLERLLEDIVKRPKRTQTRTLGPPRQRLFEIWIRRRSCAGAPWLVALPDTPCRLFVFPYAGAGALWTRGWQDRIGPGIGLCPVLLPGRESRLAETPATSLPELADLLAQALAPFLDRPFAFFGHSMGAGLAFELSRRLAPSKLIVSGARAPHLRIPSREPVPESDVRPFLPPDPRLAAILAPTLRADLELYRRWRPGPLAPLTVPLTAFAGSADPLLAPSLVEAWREHTSAAFRFRAFPGAHLYFVPDASLLLAALAEELG